MRTGARRVLAAALAAAIATAVSVSAAEMTRVEARPGGLVGLGAKGVERWSITHTGLAEGRKTPDTPVGPVILGPRVFYALGHEVLEVDPVKGRVIRRTRFPAPIVRLAARPQGAEPAVLVSISASVIAPSLWMTIAFRPDGPRPGRGGWGFHASGTAIRDARSLVTGYDGFNATTLAPAARGAAIAAFERAEAKDQTNPFLPAWRGRLLAAGGRPDEAARAFAAAADLPAASWSDLLTVSSALEIDDAREPARRAFARGFDGMRQAGIRPERVHSIITPLLYLQPPRGRLEQLATAGDVERYDEVASRLAIAFPRVEGLDRASEAIAAWMSARGRGDLAAKWTERAARARTSLHARTPRLAAELVPIVPFFAGAWIAVLATALVAGLRAGIALRKHRETDAVGWRRWLPRPPAADLIALSVVFCAALVLSTTVAGFMLRIGSYAALPPALFEDGAAAPEVERWLTRGWFAERPSNPGRQRWLDYARQEATATRAGGKYAGAPPDDASFREMAETVTLGERLRLGVTTDPANTLALIGPPAVSLLSAVPEGGGILSILLGALGLWVLGAIAGAWLPRAARFATWVVPGGPAPLSVAGGLVCGLTFAAGLALLEVDQMLRLDLLTPIVSSLVGLAIDPVRGSALNWAYVALALCLVVHLVAVWRDASHASH